ncbi:MAG: FAD-dependent oxidoreductase, partial [Lachnospiraceae bacterium]|nr:FAD-dependent oxidoreductase [Lachnospiraceae bacterium]
MADLNPALPSYVARDIIECVEAYGKKLKGFSDGDALLSGVETRTSSPLRIVRDEDLQSAIKGLYPCGEGAGYAGGIMSAAVDGIKVFEKIAGKYKGNCL